MRSQSRISHMLQQEDRLLCLRGFTILSHSILSSLPNKTHTAHTDGAVVLSNLTLLVVLTI